MWELELVDQTIDASANPEEGYDLQPQLQAFCAASLATAPTNPR